MTSCGTGSTSPFCVCTDYYGNHVPGYKAMFTNDDTNQNDYGYYCESDMIGLFGYTDGTLNTKSKYTDVKNNEAEKILEFAKSFELQYKQGDSLDNAFFSSNTPPYNPTGVATDDAFKATMPLLYYETLLLYSLLDTMDMPITINPNTYTCAAGQRPVYLKYGSYFKREGKDAFMCMTDENIKKPIFFIDPDNAAGAQRTREEIPYNLYEILDKDGKVCTSNTCDITSTDKFDFDNSPERYIGSALFESRGNIQPSSSSSLTIYLLLGLIVAGIALYGLYYLYMRQHHRDMITHMNNIKPGAGNRAAARASAAKSSNRHAMT